MRSVLAAFLFVLIVWMMTHPHEVGLWVGQVALGFHEVVDARSRP